MEQKNKKSKSGTGEKVAMGVGLGMLAAMTAGAYYLYGTKEGAKKRVKIRGWMLKAKGEVMEKLEKLKEVNEETYNTVVDSVMKKYEAVKAIDKGEVAEMLADMRKHWTNINRHLKNVNGKKSQPKLKRKAAPKKKATPPATA